MATVASRAPAPNIWPIAGYSNDAANITNSPAPPAYMALSDEAAPM
jgi:hypothetical protein